MRGHSLVKKGRSMSQKLSLTGMLFVTPFFAIYFIFNLYPILSSFYLSFFSWNGVGEKVFVGLDNYVRLVSTDPYFFKSLGNVFIILIGYLPITLFLGLLIAILLYNQHLKGRRFFQTTQFMPYIVVPVASGLLFMLLFDWGAGAVNRLLMNWGLIAGNINWLGEPRLARLVLIIMQIWRQLGYVVTIYLAGLTSISSDLLEAADIDGASGSQKLFRITVPLLSHTTLFLTVTSLIDGFQLFDAPKTLFTAGQVAAYSGGPERSVLTPVWLLYDTAFGSGTSTDMGYASAIAYGLFVVIAVFSSINIRLQTRKGENA